MYAMDSWLEQLDEEVGPYVKPLLDIVYLALDNPGARPQAERVCDTVYTVFFKSLSLNSCVFFNPSAGAGAEHLTHFDP